MLGTVCVKTWRLYYIFVVSRHCRKAGRIAADWFLITIIVILPSIDIILCTIWSSVDPLRQKTIKTLHFNGQTHVIKVEKQCGSEHGLETVFVPLFVVYKVFLIACSLFLAFLTRRIHMKNFKTRNITHLVYLLTLLYTLGLPTFLITELQGVNINIPYSILSVLLISLVFLCFALLFLPPLFPLLKEKYLQIIGTPAPTPKPSGIIALTLHSPRVANQ